jgi:hypothetical protein
MGTTTEYIYNSCARVRHAVCPCHLAPSRMSHLKAWLTLLFTVTFVASPAFTSPFSGFTREQLPIPQIDPPVQPAGYAFSIWGLIYGWLLVSAVYGVYARRGDGAWDRARTPLIASLALGTPWLAIANRSPIGATALLFAMAVCAIVALLRTPDADRRWLRAPVAIYAGWLTAASFVSLGSTAAGYGVLTNGLGWAFLGIAMALGVAVLVQRRVPRAPGYGGTVIWALVGIMVANGSAQLGVTLLAGLGVMVVGSLLVAQGRG